MRKLVLILIVFIAVATFIRALDDAKKPQTDSHHIVEITTTN